MVISDSIEVFVRRCKDGKRYAEYAAPRESSQYAGIFNEVYIEAVTGECFEVVVQPTANFNFKGCGAIQAECAPDGCEVFCSCITGKESRSSYSRDRPTERQRWYLAVSPGGGRESE